MQTYPSDWDKFNDVAAKAAAKGYKMLSGFDDAYRTFSNNVSAPWVTGTTVTVDENLMKWVGPDQGVHRQGLQQQVQPVGQPVGFRSAPPVRCSASSTPLGASTSPLLATSGNPTAEGGKEEVGNGIYGDYAVCEGRQPYYWGGT